MHALKTAPRQRVVIGVTLAALAATVLTGLQFIGSERAMQAKGYGIVPYELALTAGRAQQILDAWGPQGQQAARRSLLVDFAFIPSYALFLAGVALLIARGLAGRLQSAGFWLALAPLAAAALDAVENLALLSMLASGGATPAAPFAAGAAASAKFALLAITLLGCLAGAVSLALRRIRGAQARRQGEQ